MTTSQNGWPADPDPTKLGIAPCSVAGVPIGDGLLAGPVTVVLAYVALQVHLRVETLQPGQCWGYHFRVVTGGSDISNHGSGTAVDLDAELHPLGVRGTFTPAQVEEIHRILAEVDNVVRWGGDYTGRVDEMHFEIIGDQPTVAAVASRLGSAMQLPAVILDYSSGYPRGAAVAAASVNTVPVKGVIRYLPKEGGSVVKPITAAEYQDMTVHGLAVALIYEARDPARAAQGRAAGQHDAQWAKAQANAIGIPDPVVYFTVDYDADPAAIDLYFQGVNDVLGVGRTAGYGSFRVIEWLFDHGRITYGWQTAAWSHGARSNRAHLYQRIGEIIVGGVQCDISDVLKANFGATNQQQENDMPLSDADLEKIVTAIKYKVLAADDFRFDGRNVIDMLLAIQDTEAAQSTALATLTDDEANIIAAIRAIQTGAVDVTALVAALAPALAPLIKAGATQDQVEAAMRNVFASAGKSA